jgi:hypothetical protein
MVIAMFVLTTSSGLHYSLAYQRLQLAVWQVLFHSVRTGITLAAQPD